jgi:hypothetical protein
MVNNATYLRLSAGIIVTVTLAAAVTAAAITWDAILNLLQEVLALFLLGLPLGCRAITCVVLAVVTSFGSKGSTLARALSLHFGYALV